MSAYSLTVEGRRCAAATRTNITSISNTYDVCMLQETHLLPGDSHTLRHAMPTHTHFTNNKNSQSAGVATIISPRAHRNYDATHIPLHTDLTGHAVAVHLTPLAHCPGPRYVLLNLYLATGNNHFQRKIHQLHLLRELSNFPNSIYIVAGDLNFYESPADTSSPWTPLPSAFLEAWESFTSTFRLTEIHQPTHTFRRGRGQARAYHCTTRLDRIYCSLSESEIDVYRPSAHLAPLPHGLLTSSGDIKGLDAAHRGSDHLAVGTAFRPPAAEAPGRPRIPKWIAMDPAFSSTFEDLWSSEAACPGPFDELARLKQTFYGTKAAVLALRSSAKGYKLDAVSQLSVGIKLLRLHAKGLLCEAKSAEYARKYAFLQALRGASGSIDPTFLRGYLDGLFATHGSPDPGPEAADDRRVDLVEPKAVDSGPKPRVHGHSALASIKAILPSTCASLGGLRPSMEEPIVSDARGMSQLAAGYWSGIWTSAHPGRDDQNAGERRAAADRAAQLPEYCAPIHLAAFPVANIPTPPAEEAMATAIRSAGNSCPGPDGIPFVAGPAATVLLDVVLALTAGVLPPSGYNYGLLFLLPKKGTLLPSDTRPISVTNADNRLVARAVVSALEPYLGQVLHGAQKGFLRGRDGGLNIRAINDFYYKALKNASSASRRRHAAYLLFLDTAKVFDSIEHDFIFASLRRLHLPDWVLLLVRGLLHEVFVAPNFGGPLDVWIAIGRGVKQGCPLSPLLFVICYDSLLCVLASLPGGVRSFAFADDLAVGVRRFQSLHAAMRAIDQFKFLSGLGQNMAKTVVFSSHDSLPQLADLVSGSPWPQLAVQDRYVCLGIPVGNITLEEVFAGVMEKMETRCAKWSRAFKAMSLSQRIRTMNVFVLSMLVYVCTFFPFPYEGKVGSANKQCAALFRRHVVSMLTGYKWFHLIRAPGCFGPSPPLIDPWARALATLASQTDLSKWNDITANEIEDLRRDAPYQALVSAPFGGNLRLKNLQRIAAVDFVVADLYAQYPADGEEATFDAAPFQGPGTTLRDARRAMYNRVVYSELHLKDQAPDLTAKCTTPERGLVCTPAHIASFHANFAALTSVKPHFANVQFKLTLNALPTDRRMLWTVVRDKATRDATPRPPCYICGAAEGVNSMEHLLGGACSPVARALHDFGAAIHLDLSSTATGDQNALGSALLLWPQPHPKRAHAMTIFNSAVWFQRSQVFKLHPGTPATTTQTAARLTSEATSAWTLHQFKPKSTSLYGSAGKRTPEQLAAAVALAERTITAIDHDTTIVAYTDGASQGNPGPAGAGAIITYPGWGPGESTRHSEELAVGVRTGTNNFGELWAIGMVFNDVERKAGQGYVLPAKGAILTDSSNVRGCLADGWEAKGPNAPLVQALQTLLRDSPIPLDITWIPGHAGVLGNEAADGAATRGARTSRAGRGLANLDFRIRNCSFLT